jgi:hypothetical protein
MSLSECVDPPVSLLSYPGLCVHVGVGVAVWQRNPDAPPGAERCSRIGTGLMPCYKLSRNGNKLIRSGLALLQQPSNPGGSARRGVLV